MSKKLSRASANTGISKKKVVSKFGSKILKKFGWEEGKGLGKEKTGITEVIQVRKREDNLGVGSSKETSKWNDEWWKDMYKNSVSKAVEPVATRTRKKSTEQLLRRKKTKFIDFSPNRQNGACTRPCAARK